MEAGGPPSSQDYDAHLVPLDVLTRVISTHQQLDLSQSATDQRRDEEAFMRALLEGVAPPSSDPPRRSDATSRPNQHHPSQPHAGPSSPRQHRPSPPVTAKLEDDYAGLLDGLEGENDWEADLFDSPQKPMKCMNSSQALLRINPTPTAPPKGWTRRAWTRCNVVNICESVDVHGWAALRLDVLTHRTRHTVTLVLEGEYAQLAISIGDALNIVSPELPSVLRHSAPPFSASHPVPPSSAYPVTIIFSTFYPENFLVLHPDLLLPNTNVSTSVSCPRRSVIKGLIRTISPPTKSLIYGNILHATFQSLLSTTTPGGGPTRETFLPKSIKHTVDTVLATEEMRESTFRVGLPMEDVRAEVAEKAVESFGRRFAGRFLVDDGGEREGGRPNPTATLDSSETTLAVTGLHDIEEDIRSPMWGLQGKIDVSVQVTLLDPTSATKAEGKGESWTLPFELKTGRAVGVMEHRAQTMLYTLLMEDRYATVVPSGLLYYSSSDTLLQVPAAKHELRSLIMARNVLASYLARKRVVPGGCTALASQPMQSQPSLGSQTTIEIERERKNKLARERAEEEAMWAELDDEEVGREGEEVTGLRAFLPETIDDARICQRCYQVDACMLYRRAVERVHDDNSPIAELYDRKTGHLTERHLDFFKKWEGLIAFEEQDATKFASELWTMTAAEREKTGRCFADMVVDSYHCETGSASTNRVHRHTYRFVRNPEHSASQGPGPAPVLSGYLGPGDPISVSIEPDLLSLARGFILELQPSHVVVGLDHKLDVDVLRSRLHDRPSALGETGIVWEKEARDQPFRIDRDELASGMGRIRDNLAQLFFLEGGDDRRRSLVVDLEAPRFDATLAPKVEELKPSLNEGQRRAVEKVLTARDYALILGMPGTGKTTTIVEIILELVKRGKSILLTSYTHSAVDTILVKLLNLGLKLLRLGNADKIHPDVQHLTLGSMTPADNMEQMEHRIMSPQVVATTALTIDHPVFAKRTFDYCIVDEASQITLPVCLGPLRLAETFVLVGDHFQLPPLVKNAQARLGGLNVSLFRRLHEAHPDASVNLTQQYRMSEDIMTLSNQLIYHGKLRCGSPAVAEQKLVLPTSLRKEVARIHAACGKAAGCEESEACWLEKTLDPDARVVFLDTDNADCGELVLGKGQLVQNPGEAHLTYQLIRALLRLGMSPREIGIITLYRAQIKVLQHAFSSSSSRCNPDDDKKEERDPLMAQLREVEIITADKSQGRDKECIVLSMVKSNSLGNIGELAKDWRRINVALTRARSKLIIVGSRSTLSHDPLLGKLVALVEGRGWVVRLPEGAREMHPALESPASPLPSMKEEEEEPEEVMKTPAKPLVSSKGTQRQQMQPPMSTTPKRTPATSIAKRQAKLATPSPTKRARKAHRPALDALNDW